MAGEPQLTGVRVVLEDTNANRGRPGLAGLRAVLNDAGISYAPWLRGFRAVTEAPTNRHHPRLVGFRAITDTTLPNPDTPDITTVVAEQVDADPKGRTKVTFNWSLSPDPDHYALYRIPGNFPVLEGSDRATVLAHGSVVTVSEAIDGADTSYMDTLASTLNSSDQTYYLFAETGSCYSLACDGVFVETLPGQPQSVGKETGDEKVVLSWDAVTGANANGYNVYRCTGTWVAADAVKANSTLIPKGTGTITFEDSANNTSNRVPEGTLGFPVNGTMYTYKIEVEDTDTVWTDGTANESSGVSEDLTANKDDTGDV